MKKKGYITDFIVFASCSGRMYATYFLSKTRFIPARICSIPVGMIPFQREYDAFRWE